MRILILLLLIVGACSRSETPAPAERAPEPKAAEAVESEEAAPELEQPPTPATGEEGQQAEESAVDLDAPPTVELLDAGKPPRMPLRTTFEPGAKQSLRVKSAWVVSTLYGPLLSVESVMPSLIYDLETEVKESTEQGTRFALRVKKVTVEVGEKVKPAQAEAVKKSVGSLKGASGAFSINARGIVEDFAIDAPVETSLFVHDMVDQIEQAVRLSSLPLPEEAVGKGATWTATQTIDQRGAGIRQTATFELVDAKGERIKATNSHAAETPKQTLHWGGGSFKLDELDFSGESKGAWRLNQLGPASASEHTVTVFKMTVTEPKREVVVMAIDTTIEVKATR